MLINARTALATSRIVLVPYSEHHVLQYHAWMQDSDIQEATASEPLSLDDEYKMQRSWRQDEDKLTFISCKPDLGRCWDGDNWQQIEIDQMVGDVNLFITIDDENESMSMPIGELELMVAEKSNQRQGFGRASLLVFLHYILMHEALILEEFSKVHVECEKTTSFGHLRVRISAQNQRSLNLFESIGFTRLKPEPNVFGELELRHSDLNLVRIRQFLQSAGILDYKEMRYPLANEE